MERLIEIINEARHIVKELDSFAVEHKYSEYDDVDLRLIPYKSSLWTRFLSCCDSVGVKTLGDLLRTPSRKVLNTLNAGKKSIEEGKRVVKDYYGVDWG